MRAPLRSSFRLASISLLLAVGCPAEPGGGGLDPGEDEPDPDPLDIPEACARVQAHTGEIGPDVVQETVDLWGERTCMDYQADCLNDYESFIELAAEHARPITHDQLREALHGMQDAEQLAGPLDPDVFATETIDALGICFLLEDIDERALNTRVLRDEPDGLFGDLTGLTWYTLEFVDPWVGTLQGVLLAPDRPNGGGILGVHGHGTEARDWPDAYHALEYARQGWTVLALEMRVNASDDREDQVSMMLLEQGFSLQGLHIYEMLLGQKYLRWLPEVDPLRIGLMGHSAGSMKGSVAIRMTDGFAAYVTDNPVSFSPPNPEDGPTPLNEDMLPALQPFTDLFNDSATADLPVLAQPYGYPEGPDEVIAFFGETLD